MYSVCVAGVVPVLAIAGEVSAGTAPCRGFAVGVIVILLMLLPVIDAVGWVAGSPVPVASVCFAGGILIPFPSEDVQLVLFQN